MAGHLVPFDFSPNALHVRFQFGRFARPQLVGNAPAEAVVVGPIELRSEEKLLLLKTHQGGTNKRFLV